MSSDSGYDENGEPINDGDRGASRSVGAPPEWEPLKVRDGLWGVFQTDGYPYVLALFTNEDDAEEWAAKVCDEHGIEPDGYVVRAVRAYGVMEPRDVTGDEGA